MEWSSLVTFDDNDEGLWLLFTNIWCDHDNDDGGDDNKNDNNGDDDEKMKYIGVLRDTARAPKPTS